MFKTMFVAAAAIAVLAGATITAPVTAEAAMTCKDAAKMKYPDSLMDRVKWRRECKKHFKASMGKEGPLSKIRSKLSS
jgi:hypothetical protein